MNLPLLQQFRTVREAEFRRNQARFLKRPPIFIPPHKMELTLPDAFEQMSLESLPASQTQAKLPSDIFAFLSADLETVLHSSNGLAFASRHFGILYQIIGKTAALSATEQRKAGELLIACLVAFCKSDSEQESEGKLKDILCMLMLLFSEWLRSATEIDNRKANEVMASLLAYDLQSLWHGKKIESRFVSLMLNSSISLLVRGGSPAELMAWLYTNADRDMWLSWHARITQLFFSHKSASSLVVSVLHLVRDKPEIATGLLSEVISTLERTETFEDSESMRSVSMFVEELGEKLPHVFAVELPKIIHLLDCESYILRNAVVVAVKLYLKYLVKGTNKEELSTKRREQLFELLAGRTRDKCSYSRCKALEAIRELVAEDCTSIVVFMTAVKIAKERLSDVATLVRRSAGKLITVLVLHCKFEAEAVFQTPECIQQSLEGAKTGLAEIEARLEAVKSDESASINTEELQAMRLKLDLSVAYLSQYLEFLSDLGDCCVVLLGLIESRQVSDVHTGVEVLFILQSRGLQQASVATRKALPLIWSRDESVRTVVAFGFHGIHTNPSILSYEESIKRLIALYEETTPGERSSLSDVLKELWRRKQLRLSFMQRLKESFVEAPSEALAFFIRCGCSFEHDFFLDFYEKFAQLALNSAPKWTILREVLSAASEFGHKSERSESLLALSSRRLCNPQAPFHSSWFSCMQQLIWTAEDLGDSALDILRWCLIELCKPLIAGHSSEVQLAKCLFVVGEASLKTVIAADRIKAKLQKQQPSLNSEEAELEDVSGYHASLLLSALEQLTYIQENCIVAGNLLGFFSPLVVRLMQDLGTVRSLLTQQSVLLAFAKFLCTGQGFCRAHLPLLLAVVENEGMHPSLRSNCVVTLGDLVQRFPCALEPHADKLFARLRDKDSTVRRKAMLVVTHLVLNDMLKLRGQTIDVLLCMLDPDLRNLACLFLEELHKKDSTAIANLIPEGLSRLVSLGAVTEAQFRTVADHLLKFVEKERQQENLIDKMSLKLLSAADDGEKLRICHCYKLLVSSEKGLRRLLENVSVWQVLVLQQSEAKSVFEDIRLRLAKGWRSENRAVLEEFESRLKGATEERGHKLPLR